MINNDQWVKHMTDLRNQAEENEQKRLDAKDTEIARLKNILSGIHKGDVDILDSAIIAIEMVPCFEEGDEESQKRIVEGLRRLQAMCRMMVE
jgi:DNA-directed RNA polymerase subunit F